MKLKIADRLEDKLGEIRDALNDNAPKDSGLILEEGEDEKRSKIKQNKTKFSELPKAKSWKVVASGRVCIGAEMKRKTVKIKLSAREPKIPKVS